MVISQRGLSTEFGGKHNHEIGPSSVEKLMVVTVMVSKQ